MFVRQISRSLATGALISLPVQAVGHGLPIMPLDSGVPTGGNQNLKSASAFGILLFEDLHLIEKFGRFSHERFPERVVHAGGAGVHGGFRFNQDFPTYTRASLFEPHKNTRAFLRFSTLTHPKRSREALSGLHDFATKLYTDEGTWDLVANRSPPARSRRLILQHQSTFKKG